MTTDSMKACVVAKYGPPDEVLSVCDVPIPTSLKADEVLVKVHFAALNAGDYHIVRGDPAVMKLMFGMVRPKISALGSDFAGEIVQLGKKADEDGPWKIGDRVFGDLSDAGFGAIAEYCVAKTKFLVKVDDEKLNLRDVCALPVAGGTALGALQEANVSAGEKVLVVGASGGVGHYAVQIAANELGATVVGVCSTKNVDMVKSIGASSVIDYTVEGDFLHKRKEEFDVILDCANDKTATNDAKLALECLKPNGRYVMIGGKDIFRTMFCKGWYARQAGHGKQAMVHMAVASAEQCEELLEMLIEGKIKPHIDNTFSIEDTKKAMVIMDSGRARGKMIIEVSP